MEKILDIKKINFRRCLISLISCIIVIILANICYWANLSNALHRNWPNVGLRTLRMFTTISNLLVALAALLSIPYQIDGFRYNNYHLPRWIVYILYTGTVGVGITFMTAITAITIANGFYEAMIKETNLFLHTINPITSIILFTLINDDHHIKFKITFISLIPMFLYSIIYLVFVFIIGPNRGGWTDHYKFNQFIPWPITLIIMFSLSFGVATGLRVLHNLTHKYRKNLFIKFFQESPKIKSDTIEEAVIKLAEMNKEKKLRGEIKIPYRSLRMMKPAYKTDTSMKELIKLYVDHAIDDEAL